MLAVTVGNGTGITVVISCRTDEMMIDPPLVPLGATRETVSTHDKNELSAVVNAGGGNNDMVGDALTDSSAGLLDAAGGSDVGFV
jgi:hypothetical protein